MLDTTAHPSTPTANRIVGIPPVSGRLFELAGAWEVVRRSDPVVAALADRHYPRRARGCGRVGGPHRLIVLRAVDHTAGWITAYTVHPDDGLDAWRCTMFRNEGGGLSSTLIREAMAVTADLWGPPPPDGWLTYVDTLSIIHLRPIEGCRPAIIRVPKATHEVMLLALEPALDGRPTPKEDDPETWRFLRPFNVMEQVELPDDDEARKLLYQAVRAVLEGVLWAEPPLSGQVEPWRTVLIKSAAHARGEEHAP